MQHKEVILDLQQKHGYTILVIEQIQDFYCLQAHLVIRFGIWDLVFEGYTRYFHLVQPSNPKFLTLPIEPIKFYFSLKRRHPTQLPCPFKVHIQIPLSTFQRLIVWSSEPLITNGYSYCKQRTRFVWPFRVLTNEQPFFI